MVCPRFRSTPENVIQVTKIADGRVVFLEKGTSATGLQHILELHALDFVGKGIALADIPSVVMQAVSKGKAVGTSGSAPLYEILYGGKPKYNSVGVGFNGYIVRSNPVSEWKPLK